MTTGLLETKITYLIYDLHRSESGFSIPKLKQSIIHVLQVKKRNLLLSRIQGYHYCLSKFHIYVLVYCIGVFLPGLLHSVIIGSSFIHLIRTDSNVFFLMAE